MALKHKFMIQIQMTGDSETTKEMTEKQLLAYIAEMYPGQQPGVDVKVWLLTPWPLEDGDQRCINCKQLYYGWNGGPKVCSSNCAADKGLVPTDVPNVYAKMPSKPAQVKGTAKHTHPAGVSFHSGCGACKAEGKGK